MDDKFYKKLLAVGCPRSGSRFLTKVLRNNGFKIGHEMFKKEGTIGMFFAVEDCWYPGKHWTVDEAHPIEDESRCRRSDFVFEQVWHYVRDPLNCIPSMASRQLPGGIWVWAERHTGISCGLFPKKLRAMYFWIQWNELIEQNEKIDFFLRIEDIDSNWDEIKERLGLKSDAVIPEQIPRDYGTEETGPNRHVAMTWDEMEALDSYAARRIREMAERYGYKY